MVSERLTVAQSARDELCKSYEEAMRDAYEGARAIVDEAVERAEARRRVYVDLDGIAVIAYVRSRRRGMSRREEHPGLSEARRALRLATRQPTEADRPPVRPLPGPKPKLIPGQLRLDGDEAT